MTVQQYHPPRVHVNINAIGAVLPQHLMLEILDSEDLLGLRLAELGQVVEDGGLAGVLETKHPDHQEVSVVSEVVSDTITETVILINQF